MSDTTAPATSAPWKTLTPPPYASPLLTADEAIALINEGNRSVAVLTYGWLSCDDPDPDGQRMRVLQSSLRASDMRYLKGLFWECAVAANRLKAPLYAAKALSLVPCRLSCVMRRIESSGVDIAQRSAERVSFYPCLCVRDTLRRTTHGASAFSIGPCHGQQG